MTSYIDIEIPHEYKCPITLDIMCDPVICTDGFTYEREAIKLLNNPISPITKQPIIKDLLIPNIALRQLISQFAEINNIQLNVKRENNSQLQTFDDILNNLLSYDVQILENFENNSPQTLRVKYVGIVDKINLLIANVKTLDNVRANFLEKMQLKVTANR